MMKSHCALQSLGFSIFLTSKLQYGLFDRENINQQLSKPEGMLISSKPGLLFWDEFCSQTPYRSEI